MYTVCSSCKTVRSPRAKGKHIMQIPSAYVTFNNYVTLLSGKLKADESRNLLIGMGDTSTKVPMPILHDT